jgi:hypothetical protein
MKKATAFASKASANAGNLFMAQIALQINQKLSSLFIKLA